MSIDSATRNSSIRDCTAIKGAKAVQLRAQQLKTKDQSFQPAWLQAISAPDFLPKKPPCSLGVLFRCGPGERSLQRALSYKQGTTTHCKMSESAVALPLVGLGKLSGNIENQVMWPLYACVLYPNLKRSRRCTRRRSRLRIRVTRSDDAMTQSTRAIAITLREVTKVK